jgi:GntR family transcriptional regulator/MocR family aminotransferase
VRIDSEGLRVDKLAELSRRERIRAVYLTPHHQYPTTVSLSPRRRMELLHLARTRRFAVLEDDYDHEVHFDGHPLVPLASVDRLESVLYIGSLSKIFAPGLRLGYVVAPQPVVEHLAAQRSAIDLSGNGGIELAVAELFEEGEVQRHLRRMAGIYRERRDALVTGLREHLHDVLEFETPSGGTAVWCRVPRRSSVDGWVKRCRAAGATFQSGSAFAFRKRPIPAVRIGFTRATEREIGRAIRIMVDCWPK